MSSEKRKVRFNAVDAIVLAAILLVVAGVCYQLFGAKVQNITAPKVKLSFVATVYNARWEVVESILAEDFNARPAQMVAGNGFVPDAYVTGAAYQNSVSTVESPDGGLMVSEDPRLYDVTFTMEAEIPNDAAIIKVGAQEVRIGKGFVIKTRTVEIGSQVNSLTLSDK